MNDGGMSTGPPRPPPEWRESGRALPNLILAAALVALGLLFTAMAVSVYAIFTASTSVTDNDFASDTLQPPSGLTAPVSGGDVNLSWTATADTYASGHSVLRGTASGGPYSQIAEVTPRTTTTYTDSPAGGTYYYVARAFYQSWESGNSNEVSATVSTTNTGLVSPGAQAAVTTDSGNNDGFEVTPSNAFDNDGAFAGDDNSGSGNDTDCASTAKDRHLFYNYGFSIPAGSTIGGIEVRLDAWADDTKKDPFMCVELSWDGGATWTAVPKTTSILGASEATFFVGSASDTWGRTWSDTEFTNANFRVRITNVANTTIRDFRLDWVPVRVTYTPP